MAKDKSKRGGKSGMKIPKEIAGVRIPKALRDSGKVALKLAQTPAARELLSAGLLAAAAAVSAKSRSRNAGAAATTDPAANLADVANMAADNAGKIGAAFVSAASEAAQRFFAKDAPTPQATEEAWPIDPEASATVPAAETDRSETLSGDGPGADLKPPAKRPRTSKPSARAIKPNGVTESPAATDTTS